MSYRVRSGAMQCDARARRKGPVFCKFGTGKGVARRVGLIVWWYSRVAGQMLARGMGTVKAERSCSKVGWVGGQVHLLHILGPGWWSLLRIALAPSWARHHGRQAQPHLAAARVALHVPPATLEIYMGGCTHR